MTTTAECPAQDSTSESARGAVVVSTLADGLVVRLAGVLGTDEADLLREVLLRPRPAACNDILVDAGDVRGIDDGTLAVLLAASTWAACTDGRLAFTRISADLAETATSLGLLPQLRVLAAPGARSH